MSKIRIQACPAMLLDRARDALDSWVARAREALSVEPWLLSIHSPTSLILIQKSTKQWDTGPLNEAMIQEKSVEEISAMRPSEGRITKRGTRPIGVELFFKAFLQSEGLPGGKKAF
jgi:hypothetical protein